MFLHDLLQIPSERTYTDEGFLIVPSRISRTGIQEYTAAEMGLSDRDPTDIIRVFRPEEEVFSNESLLSFSNKPVTNNHPPVLVDASNFKEYSVGHSSKEISRDGMFVKAELTIMDLDSIKAIESGKSELSNGYTSDIEWTEGISPDGESFDAVQRKIKGNHIAIVERGRAGFACRVADNLPDTGAGAIMAKVLIDGVDFEMPDQAAQAVGKLQARLTDAEEETSKKAEELKKKEDEMEEAEKEAKAKEDSLNAKLDDAKSKLPTSDSIDKLVADRCLLTDSVLKIIPDFEFTGKDADTIRKEVVGAKCANVQMDSVSSDYISARFDMLLESVDGNPQLNLDNAFKSSVDKNLNIKDTRSEGTIARDKFMEDSRSAWNTNKENK